MANNLVSIILPFYSNYVNLSNSINSIINQTYRNIYISIKYKN
jgi:hypothetical protein